MKVGFQGILGSYSEVALRRFFEGESVTPCDFPHSQQVFEALTQKSIDAAIIPVENSIVGNVTVNTDLLFESPVTIIGEAYLHIKHHLLALKGASFKDIKVVHSHPIALAQCQDFFYERNIKTIPDFDTAGSCKYISELNDPSVAAVGSILCSEYYNLDVISDDIQHQKDNFTRFQILTHQDCKPKELMEEKTSVAFSANHKPGALLDSLQVFKRFSLNLTKLESRPIPTDPFKYVFYVDFINSPWEEIQERCLRELAETTEKLKILGSYPNGKNYLL